ncbi:Uncharacterised protein [Capnocytophaga ochracea]|uniref:Uncharacterized protein n=1 Tax=Capnocytophaga ochracea TaxID=1018 RepID=A0A2X2RJ46_CAPOC|nr:Uncharacterised protein [Capnocytophaga ochracea]
MKRIILLSLIFLSLVGYAQISTEEEFPAGVSL